MGKTIVAKKIETHCQANYTRCDMLISYDNYIPFIIYKQYIYVIQYVYKTVTLMHTEKKNKRSHGLHEA